MKTGSDCNLKKKKKGPDEKEIQEVIVSLAAANEISIDDAVAVAEKDWPWQELNTAARRG